MHPGKRLAGADGRVESERAATAHPPASNGWLSPPAPPAPATAAPSGHAPRAHRRRRPGTRRGASTPPSRLRPVSGCSRVGVVSVGGGFHGCAVYLVGLQGLFLGGPSRGLQGRFWHSPMSGCDGSCFKRPPSLLRRSEPLPSKAQNPAYDNPKASAARQSPCPQLTCTSHRSTAPLAAAGRMRVTNGTTSPSTDTIPLMSPLGSKLSSWLGVCGMVVGDWMNRSFGLSRLVRG